MVRIGITERGDAGIDLSWKHKLSSVEGAILITKNCTEGFIQSVLRCSKPCIVHVTCTGYGGTALEPNVPNYVSQIQNAANMITNGFPANRVVMRIDPIFPTTKGLHKFEIVLREYIRVLAPLGVCRIRISILDEYIHVKKRFLNHGWNPIYGNRFQPTVEQIRQVSEVLSSQGFTFETCAEPLLSSCDAVEEIGCVSFRDMELMGLLVEGISCDLNPQNRRGCKCLSSKTELLNNKKKCSNGCVYCYWKD